MGPIMPPMFVAMESLLSACREPVSDPVQLQQSVSGWRATPALGVGQSGGWL
jgi:hypothetical protein